MDDGQREIDDRGRRVTVMGLGHFGGQVAATGYLAARGARLTVTDLADETVLAHSLGALRDLDRIRYRLGGHDEADFRDADLVVVSPAVRLDHPLLAVARRSGARVTSEIELFLEACPATIVGVTGTNGKSTTAAMTAAIVAADGRNVWLGGNIGHSLLEDVDRISADDVVVLELSSFQLAHLDECFRRPEVAVVTNLAANHLNWHGSFDQYVAAKQRILIGQTPDGVAVLDADDPELRRWLKLVRGRVSPPVAKARLPALQVAGQHNRRNAACAAAAAIACGCSWTAVERGLTSFKGLPLRIEPIAEFAGCIYYNDSAATTPESTIAALAALDRPTQMLPSPLVGEGSGVRGTRPCWLIAGGADKGAAWDPLVRMVIKRARGAAFFGSVRETLRQHCLAHAADFPCTSVERLDDALSWCWQRAAPGEAILFSPGCASVDQYQNYVARGEHFNWLVGELAAGGRTAREKPFCGIHGLRSSSRF